MANCYIPCVECGSKHLNDGALCDRCRSTPRKMVRGDLVSCSIFPQVTTPPEKSWGSIEVEYGRRQHNKVWVVWVSCPPRYSQLRACSPSCSYPSKRTWDDGWEAG